MKPALTHEQYMVERAIVDRAESVVRRLAPVIYHRGGALPAKVSEHPDYRACDSAMCGRVEQFELLTDTPERFVAYVGSQTREQRDATNIVACQSWPLTTWTGDLLGSVTLGSGWRVNSFVGSRMFQAYARVNGREFTGRTFGEGMSIVLRETAESKRRRGA